MAKKLFGFINDSLFGKHLGFRVQLFNLLALAGTTVAFILGLLTLIAGGSFYVVLIDFAAALAAAVLLHYSMRTQKYVRCYYITIFAIFLCLFPYLYFVMGGYKGGMPLLFVFAIVFKAFMLEKKQAYFIIALELAIYSAFIVASYLYPHTLASLPDEFAYFTSTLMDFVIVALALALMVLAHFGMYNRQQRELEQAREAALVASDAKSRFLANMSHEIRTPINIMLGMNEVILRESDSEQIRSYSLNAESAGRTLMTLIDNVLDLSAIEKGLIEISEKQYETSMLIASLSLIGNENAKKRNLEFTVSADENLPRLLHGDETHIHQIVSNFLSNSAKYTERGSIALSLQFLPADDGTGEAMLRITVADTGIGIKQESIPYLFDPFTRADVLQTQNIEGSGLGLAIAKEYADRMDGRIGIASEPGKGSTFTLEVPQKVVDATPIGTWEQNVLIDGTASAGNSFTAPGLNILIVDDSSENISVIKSLLSRTFMRMDSASSGAECLEAVGKQHYDAILMDYMMPGMDGIETLHLLKGLPDFDTPVIALTSNVVAGVREEILEAGFHQYLSKPVMWQDLESALLDALPPERVNLRGLDEPRQIPESLKDELSRELEFHGIVLNDGLMYVNGDIAQYAKSAAIFAEAHETATAAIKMLSAQNDWEGLKLHVHSLKGNARNLGAGGLSDTAAKLERLCAAGDAALVAAGLPLLYLEWERAREGFSVFERLLGDALPERGAEIHPSAGFDELLAMLKANKYHSAMIAIDSLIETCNDPGEAEIWHELRQRTHEMKFREAENLLTALIESGSGFPLL